MLQAAFLHLQHPSPMGRRMCLFLQELYHFLFMWAPYSPSAGPSPSSTDLPTIFARSSAATLGEPAGICCVQVFDARWKCGISSPAMRTLPLSPRSLRVGSGGRQRSKIAPTPKALQVAMGRGLCMKHIVGLAICMPILSL